SQAGIDLIATIQEELLKSAKLTGIWENKLRRIERGEYSAGEFIAELKQQISEIVLAVLSDNSQRKIVVKTDIAAKGAGSTASKAGDSPEKPKAPAKKRAPAVKSLEQIACPVCGNGHLIKGRTAYGCSEFRSGCALRLQFEEYPAELTPAKLNAAIKKAFKNQKT
ncbi:MAG: DNA topoisomerase III, partial [Muribaculaceae bacterium]|nr:DNA topoisomerase III [Muribaculaceae bacterium]